MTNGSPPSPSSGRVARAQPQTPKAWPPATDGTVRAKRWSPATASGSTTAGGLPPAILFDANDGALRVARTLVQRGVPVHVLARPPFSFVAHSRGVEGRIMPTIASEPESWLSELERLAAGGPAVVVSGSDAATELLCRERARISPHLRMFESQDGAHLALMDKATSHAIAEAAGLRVPWKWEVTCAADLAEVADRADYPCVTKPILGHLGRPGGHQTRFARDRSELRDQVARALDDGVAMLVTEHVPGGEENLETVVILRSADGSKPLVYGKRKLRQWPPDFGSGSIHRSAPMPDTIELAGRLVDQAGLVGQASVEFKRHAGTGELVLIEANARLPQGFGVGDACGVDASWRLYATLAGLPLGPQPSQRHGVAALVLGLEVRAAWARLRGGDLTVRELLRSYHDFGDLGLLNMRDPGPAFAMGLRVATVLWRRALNRRPRRAGRL